MMNDLFLPSYSEFIQRSEMIKNRQERLIQVRKQSKRMATEFLEKMRREAEKQYENTERHVLEEICELHSKELASMRRVYEECVTKINQEHYTNSMKTRANKIYSISKDKSAKKCSLEDNQSSGYVTTSEKIPKKNDIVLISSKFNDSQLPKSTVTNSKITGQNAIKETSSKTTVLNKKKDNSKRVPIPKQIHTSIYHKKCVDWNLKNSSSPEKDISRVKIVTNQDCEALPNVISLDKDQITKVTNPLLNSLIRKNADDFLSSYIQNVHDRIRILEQKEKMLQRQGIFLPEFNRVSKSLSGKYSEKIEVLEKSNSRSCKETSTQVPIPVSKTEPPKDPINFTSKEVCSTAVQTSHVCKKKERRCKRATLAKNEDMIIFIRNQNEISTDNFSKNQVTSNSNDTEPSSNDNEEKVTLPVEKTTKANINVFKIDPKVKKLDNWRRLFNNGEKLSESSYFSPPGTTRNKENTIKRTKKHCRRHTLKNNIDQESEKDLGYYVAKLLLMSPESIENLNSIGEETLSSISMDEVENEVRKSLSPDSNDTENIDEEEFIRRMLEVDIPKQQNKEKCSSRSYHSPINNFRVTSTSHDSPTITETDINSKTSSISLPENRFFSTENKLSKTRKSPVDHSKNILGDTSAELNLDSRLSGWIETSIRRTLEASAINSTSSHEENDNVRQVNRLIQSLVEKTDFFSSSEKSSSTRFSFSPIPVPNIQLSIPQLSGTSS